MHKTITIIILLKNVQNKKEIQKRGIATTTISQIKELRNIVVSVAGSFLPLEILSLHQCLNTTLEHRNVWSESRVHLLDGLDGREGRRGRKGRRGGEGKEGGREGGM